MGTPAPDDVPPGPRPRHTADDMGDFPMVLWPALTLIGFVLITALVIAMGTQSTARYEREQRATRSRGSRQTAGEPVGATSA